MKEPLYLDGHHYNSHNRHRKEDISFYVEIAKGKTSILELACGTGRISCELAQEGHTVTGIDTSPSMLSVARQTAKEKGLKLTFLQDDCRTFQLDQIFDLILFPFNSIDYLADLPSLFSCLQQVSKHLHDKGRFIFDTLHPNLHQLIREPKEKQRTFSYPDPTSGELITIDETTHYDPVSQINHIIWHYQSSTLNQIELLKKRTFFPQELDAILQLHSFKTHQKYGCFQKSPFTSQSKSQIFICGKA